MTDLSDARLYVAICDDGRIVHDSRLDSLGLDVQKLLACVADNIIEAGKGDRYAFVIDWDSVEIDYDA